MNMQKDEMMCTVKNDEVCWNIYYILCDEKAARDLPPTP